MLLRKRPIRRATAAPRWLSFATPTIICLAACSNKSDGPGSNVDEFARFWADCSSFCQKGESCGIQGAAACAAYCAPADLTKNAVVSAGLAADDLRRCQDAQQLADTCQAGLSCDQLIGNSSACALQSMAANTNCSLVISAVDLYSRVHATIPIFGFFAGTFGGSDKGSLMGWIAPWGVMSASGSGTSIGAIDGAGTVTGTTLTLNGGGFGTNRTATITFTGTLNGATGADAGAGTFTGEGTWQSSLGGSGTFQIESN